MKSWKWRSVFAAALSWAVLCGAGDSGAGLRVTALGNEGFLIAAGDSKVLVDGLYRGLGGYVVPTQAQVRKRELAESPFDDVDLVLVTHHHADHFDAGVVGRYLESNPNAVLIATPTAVDLLLAEGNRPRSFSDRVRAVYPEEGVSRRLEFDGMSVEVLNLHHGHQRKPPVENLGFVVDLSGIRFLHIGDTESTAEELATLDLGRRNIDVAFVPYWHLLEREAAGDYLEAIGAAAVVAMHLPDADAPAAYLAPATDLEGLIRMVEEGAPGVIVLTDVMDKKEIRTGG